MKKLIALLLALMITAGGVFAYADEPVEIEDPAAAAEETESSPLFERAPAIGHFSANRASLPTTTDRVTIDDENGIYQVVTASGTEMTLEVPFGYIVLTQDLMKQLNLYYMLFDNPKDAVKYAIERGIHLRIVDMNTWNEINVYEEDDDLADLVGDMNDLDDASMKVVENFIASNYFPGYTAKTHKVGNNTFVVIDLVEDYGCLVYMNFTNGKAIELVSFGDSAKDITASVDTAIEGLTLKAAE